MKAGLRRLLKLQVGYQNYEWGSIGDASEVYALAMNSNTQLNPALPYAELWMGTHVNCPSRVEAKEEEGSNAKLLSDVISEHSDFYLGGRENMSEPGGQSRDLVYLFKVLSIAKALSIQAHPDKKLAEKLHEMHPNIYKDSNHKPEMCIALTEFEALCNFRPKEEIINAINTVDELRALIRNEEIIKQFAVHPIEQTLQKLLASLLDADQQSIEHQTKSLVERIAKKEQKDRSSREILSLKLNEQFPNDIGIFVAYLLNHVFLLPDEALVLNQNEPHAYIAGNCIECMAASDNVVRVGLTPKFKDKDTLCQMLTYKMKEADKLKPQVIRSSGDGRETIAVYIPELYNEFRCMKISLTNGENTSDVAFSNGSILLVSQGEGDLSVLHKEDSELMHVRKGDVFFLAANSNFRFTQAKSLIVYACYSDV